jgi:hypothetical protein
MALVSPPKLNWKLTLSFKEGVDMVWCQLPGVSDSLSGGLIEPNIEDFLPSIRSNRIASAASDNGSCTVYLDDDGMYRCSFHRYKVALNDTTVKTEQEVLKWLNEWLPKVHPSKNSTEE